MRELDVMEVPLQGLHLIEASAGTGKTHTITTLYLRLLLELQLRVDGILVVTFTRAAAAELRERIRSRIRRAIAAFEHGDPFDDSALQELLQARDGMDLTSDRACLAEALRNFDEASISTIHGFCQRMLREHAFESGTSFDAELIADDREILREIVEDFWAKMTFDAPPLLVHHLRRSLGLSQLAELASRVASGGEVLVLPRDEDVQSVELQPVVERWRMVHREVAEVWRSQRSEILGLLDEPGVLRKNSYGPSQVEQLAHGMDRVMHLREPCARWVFGQLDKLTTASIDRAVRKHAPRRPRHRMFDLCQQLCDMDEAVEDALNQACLAIKRDLIDYVGAELEARKRRMDHESYDDLLRQLRDAVQRSPELRHRIRQSYPAVLIDEFQDTDPIQYRIFRQSYQGEQQSIFLIGDPKQAIYGFRGADVHAYFGATEDAGEEVYTLQTNYRSDPGLIGALNGLFGRLRRPFAFEEIEYHPVRPRPEAVERLSGNPQQITPLRLLVARRESLGLEPNKWIDKSWGAEQLARIVAGEVCKTLTSDLRIGDRPVAPADLAVLTRTNRQAHEVQTALRDLRIPAVLHTEASVFETAEAEQLERLLRAMVDPSDSPAIRAALAGDCLGVEAAKLQALVDDEQQWSEIVEAFQRWQEIWRQHGVIPAVRRVMEAKSVYARLLQMVDGERRLTNLFHLLELVQQAARSGHLGPAATVAWLRDMRVDEALRREQVGESAQLRLESDAEAVRLVTVHKSKGLQYPIVFCTHLWDGRLLHQTDHRWPKFHDPHHDHRQTLDIGSDDIEEHRQAARHEALSENLRLLYVALTRAQHRVDVIWGAFKNCETAALGYVLHQPKDTDDPTEATRSRIGQFKAGDDELLHDLRSLVASSGGAIGMYPLDATPVSPWHGPDVDVARLAPRSRVRHVQSVFGLSSFSRMLGAGSREIGDGEPDPTTEEISPNQERPSSPSVPLAEFPTGAHAGQFFHGVLEHHGAGGDYAALSDCVRDHLVRHGFAASVWTEPVSGALAEVLATPLWAGGPSLADISMPRRATEMEFTIPVGTPLVSSIEPRALASVVDAHGSGLAREYAPQLARLGFGAVVGYLRGFIDLVFEHEGRYYVVDYKSNFLGPCFADYDRKNIGRAMRHHHYVLQSYLYCLAVHRHLKRTLAHYDYTRNFGGVAYLFIRGMSPAWGPKLGIHFEMPSPELVEGWSRLFDGEGA